MILYRYNATIALNGTKSSTGKFTWSDDNMKTLAVGTKYASVNFAASSDVSFSLDVFLSLLDDFLFLLDVSYFSKVVTASI